MATLHLPPTTPPRVGRHVMRRMTERVPHGGPWVVVLESSWGGSQAHRMVATSGLTAADVVLAMPQWELREAVRTRHHTSAAARRAALRYWAGNEQGGDTPLTGPLAVTGICDGDLPDASRLWSLTYAAHGHAVSTLLDVASTGDEVWLCAPLRCTGLLGIPALAGQLQSVLHALALAAPEHDNVPLAVAVDPPTSSLLRQLAPSSVYVGQRNDDGVVPRAVLAATLAGDHGPDNGHYELDAWVTTAARALA
jgi:hypothetical protein